jgi:HPt (histidine-containing phosphotransfer) domain-containing protein
MGLTAKALQRLRDAVGEDDAVIADILQSFVDEQAGLLDKLFTAAANGDAPTMGRVAHTLKSLCRDLGDETAGDLCARLERDAREGELQEVGTTAELIIASCRSLEAEVVSYLKDNSRVRRAERPDI